MSIVKLVPRNYSLSAVEYVRDLLIRCESGEVTSVTVVEHLPGGTYHVGGSAASSRTQIAGMLLDAAIVRLQQ